MNSSTIVDYLRLSFLFLKPAVSLKGKTSARETPYLNGVLGGLQPKLDVSNGKYM